MRARRETVEHPFGVSAAWARFLRKAAEVATEMALSVLAYNLTDVMNIVGTGPDRDNRSVSHRRFAHPRCRCAFGD
jgi:hypothetical protein